MCSAARSYYASVHKEKDFSLYNTPVLDFIQAKQEITSNPMIVVICENSNYASGLIQVLKHFSENVFAFSDPVDVREKIKKQKPAVWIVSDTLIKQTDQPWRTDKTTPVILLSRNSDTDYSIVKNDGMLAVLTMPIRPETLRNAVKTYLL